VPAPRQRWGDAACRAFTWPIDCATSPNDAHDQAPQSIPSPCRNSRIGPGARRRTRLRAASRTELQFVPRNGRLAGPIGRDQPAHDHQRALAADTQSARDRTRWRAAEPPFDPAAGRALSCPPCRRSANQPGA